MSTKLEIPQPSEPSKLFTESRWLFAQLAWFITEKALKIETLSDESVANLKRTNELLKDHSAVVYMNHVKKEDVLVIPLLVTYLRNAKNLMGPAGLKHFDYDRDKEAARFYAFLRHLHILTLPVLQKSDTEKERYSPEEIALISNQLRVLSEEAMGTAGNVYGITPEETRNRSNNLQVARTGIGRMEQYHEPTDTIYVPMALLYPPLTKKTIVNIGEPKFLPEILDLNKLPGRETLEESKKRAKMITTAHMYRLAALLPPENQGYYSLTTKPS